MQEEQNRDFSNNNIICKHYKVLLLLYFEFLYKLHKLHRAKGAGSHKIANANDDNTMNH